MSNVATEIVASTKPHSRQPSRKPRDRINLPDGDYLEPRAKFANQTLGVCDKTVARMNLLTKYISNVAYVPHNASLQEIAKGVRRRNEPLKKRRGHR